MNSLILVSALLGATLAAPALSAGPAADLGELFRQNMMMQRGPARDTGLSLAPFIGTSSPFVLHNHLVPPHGLMLHRAEGDERIMEPAMARSYGGYYDLSSELAGFGAGSVAGSAAGALGLFPHARLGACAVPLLVSCSPNVVSGHLVKPHAPTSYSASSYRAVGQKDNIDAEMKKSTNQEAKNAWSEAERSTMGATGEQHITFMSPSRQQLLHDGQLTSPGTHSQPGMYTHVDTIHQSSHI